MRIEYLLYLITKRVEEEKKRHLETFRMLEITFPFHYFLLALPFERKKKKETRDSCCYCAVIVVVMHFLLGYVVFVLS